jgi:hypothetical protein
MTKAVYDTNANGVVDTCDALAWSKLTGVPTTFTPNAHASTHNLGGMDAIAPDWTQVANKPTSFTPSAHEATHLDNGTDPIPVATTLRTGLAPKLSGSNTTFLDGTGTFSTPSGGGGGVPEAPTDGQQYGRQSANWTVVPAVPAASSTTPAMDGTAAVGTGTTYARNDHVHPSDTSRMAVGAAPTAHEASHVTGSDQIPSASSSARGLMAQLSGNTTDFVDGTNACQNLVSAITPTITSVRLRSFNAIGNPNFECNQRWPAGVVTNPNTSFWPVDRWVYQKTALTAALNIGQASPPMPALVPGTNFRISSQCLSVTLTTAQASLGATDFCLFTQYVEGPSLRELVSDVHSISLLVYTSVAGLKFALTLRDTALTRTLTKLCTVSSANTWTLITLANLPLWDAGATWSVLPGVAGYNINICLAAGTSQIAPAADTWQSGNFLGAPGMSNFLSSPTSSTFYCAAVQHEPGAVCTQLMDLPFSGPNGSLQACQRYYQKSYDYATAVGATANVAGMASFPQSAAGTAAYAPVQFKQTMAKAPTVTLYNHSTGAAGSVQDAAAVNHTGAAASTVGQNGFYAITFTTATTAAMAVFAHYISDTGW